MTKPTTLYRHFDENGVLLYVGISRKLLARIYNHEIRSPWFHLVHNIRTTHFPSAELAESAEAVAIATEFPLHNVSEGRTVAARKAASIARNRDKAIA